MNLPDNRGRTIEVGYLARVEGEGAMHVRVRDGRVEEVRFEIFEPPRFFEAFMRGRRFTEAPDVTARICGICPVAYQMSSVHAMEHAAGVAVTGELRALRRLLYCGEWIESHALHMYLLHAPDFLGYETAVHMARDHREIVERGLQLKKVGNELVSLLGGREIHPINVRLGGFYRVPTRAELRPMIERLEWARGAAADTLDWVGRLDFPDFCPDYELVALRHSDEYPFNEGRIVSNRGLDIDPAEFNEYITEEQVQHSTSFHSRIRGRGAFHVGPLARYSLNFDKLSPAVQAAARSAGLGETCTNPFQSIVVRGVEVLHAIDEALLIIESYRRPPEPAVPVPPREGEGHACTEAPRGILYHRYRIDKEGVILDAQITPPTAQNQMSIEEDLRRFVADHLHLDDDELTWKLEQAIRNYDPCISCSTHFLKLEIDRG